MPRSVKAAEYERVSRLRKTYDVQANMLGWTKLDVLSAYLTEEDQLIVFDKQERRLAGDAVPLPAEIENARLPEIVAPADVPTKQFGPRWNAGRQRIAEALAALDLSEIKHKEALSVFEQIAATALRGVQILREHKGPDWREVIGLEETS